MNTMIEARYTDYSNIEYLIQYQECDTFSLLPVEKVSQCYAVCFTGNSNDILIVHNKSKNTWGLVGGTIENNETYEETLKRELLEEGNLLVLNYKPIGYQKVITMHNGSYTYQLRFMCNVEALDPFTKDPAGRVDKVAIIDMREYREYFDWGEIGEKIMKKGLKLKNSK